MSRDFNGTTAFLRAGSAPLTAAPFSIALWTQVDVLGGLDRTLWWMGDSTAPNHAWQIMIDKTTDEVELSVRAGGGATLAKSAIPITATVWHHVVAVEASSTDHRIFLDGGNKGTSTTARVPANTDRLSIGVEDDSTQGQFADGRIAHVAMWNIALTDQEVASLANGVNPLFMRPEALVLYAPINGNQSPELDIVGGQTLANTASTLFRDEPPIDRSIVTV